MMVAGWGRRSTIRTRFSCLMTLVVAIASIVHGQSPTALADVLACFAVPTQPSPADVTVQVRPPAIAVGDFNGDGRADFVSATFNADGASIRLGNGNGTFLAAPDVSTGASSTAIVSADFNDDGRLDLAIATLDFSGSTTFLSIRLGNGDGTFVSAPNVPVGKTPVDMAVGDFNKDGKVDIATANHDSNTISIALGNGNGTFTAGADIPTPSPPGSVAAGDFNLDGKIDLAIGFGDGSGGGVAIRLATGTGTFGSPFTISVQGSPRQIVTGDFNRDGKVDLAISLSSHGTVDLRLGTGDISFLPAGVLSLPQAPGLLAVADVNADGQLDLVIGNGEPFSTHVRVRLGNGDGTFSSAADVSVGVNPVALAAGDLDGDGLLDLAVSNQVSNTISIRHGVGNGTFTDVGSVNVGGNPFSLALGQLSDDSRLDLVVANAAANTVSVRLNTCGQNLVARAQAPPAQTMAEDGTLTFSAATSNAILVTDDGRSSRIRVTLTTLSGALTLGTTAGLSFGAGDGTADPTMTFSGTLAQVNAALGGLRFQPTPNYAGPATITVTVGEDANTGSADPSVNVATITVTVTAANDPPVAANDAFTVAAGGTLTIATPGVLGNDSDVDTSPASLTATRVDTVAHGTLTLDTGGGFTYQPAAGFVGTDTFTYRASDGSAQSNLATVTIIVMKAAVDPAPIAQNDSFSVVTGTPLTIAAPGVLANDTDPDGHPLTAVLVTGPTHGRLDLSANGVFTFTPDSGYAGPDSFTYRATDGAQPSNVATAAITVTPTECVPRPRVRTSPAAGGGKLSVHIEATPLNTQENNPLQSVRFGALQNAKVVLNGQSIASGQVMATPTGVVFVDFVVERLVPGRATMVPFTVVDGCGVWQTFVGGGAGAGF